MTGAASDVRLVPARPLVIAPVDVIFRLAPGDRPLVAASESVVVGAPIAERLRDPGLEEIHVPTALEPQPGGRWSGPADGRDGLESGELVFSWRGRWRVAGGALSDPLETPFAGIVRGVRPGTSITIRAAGRGLRGIVALGGPTRGRLQGSPDSELRAGGLDVNSAGAILVVGSRVDAETLTRARAMGVRGVVVTGLSSKERRDYLASEARQRSALHRLPPFAVLVLDGAVRRPVAGAVLALLGALSGHEVAIVTDPPMLVFDIPSLTVPTPPADLVRVRGGALAGREGRFVEAIGARRFPGGAHLEACLVRFPDGTTAAVPLGDLERFV
ncbi:MAG: hypothetical protein Q7S35_06545 [Candidatus Limnocylindrales bacterium]|nr:hypothetical protein [Candidatus Limnocylindrales bacterium]